MTQGGSNADIVLADGFVKGLYDGIDWKAGYAAVKKDAEVEPYDWSNEGRGGLASWKRLNYIPVEDFDHVGFGTLTRSISRTLEYAYDDFGIAQMASGLLHIGDAEKYATTSGYWQNLFKKDQTSFINGTNTGFTGFFQPRHLNRTWGYQVSTPRLRECISDSLGSNNMLQHRRQRQILLTPKQRRRNIRIQHLGIPIVRLLFTLNHSTRLIKRPASSPTTWQPS